MKTFYEMDNIGHAKYSVNFHDGVQKHRDGSEFYDIRIFRNKAAKDAFVRKLVAEGYRLGTRSIYSTVSK